MSVVNQLNKEGVVHALNPNCPACVHYLSRFGSSASSVPLHCVDVSSPKNQRWAKKNNITHTPTAVYADGSRVDYTLLQNPKKMLEEARKRNKKKGKFGGSVQNNYSSNWSMVFRDYGK